MPLVWGVTKIVPFAHENHAIDKEQLLVFEFMSAYKDLRAVCPKGNLRIHLSVEGSADEVGAKETE
jgi:hypothetical protein